MGSPTRSAEAASLRAAQPAECRNTIALNPDRHARHRSLLSLSHTAAADACPCGRDVSGHRWLPLPPIPPGRRA